MSMIEYTYRFYGDQYSNCRHCGFCVDGYCHYLERQVNAEWSCVAFKCAEYFEKQMNTIIELHRQIYSKLTSEMTKGDV